MIDSPETDLEHGVANVRHSEDPVETDSNLLEDTVVAVQIRETATAKNTAMIPQTTMMAAIRALASRDAVPSVAVPADGSSDMARAISLDQIPLSKTGSVWPVFGVLYPSQLAGSGDTDRRYHSISSKLVQCW